MANAVKILKDLSSSKFNGISTVVKEFLQPVLDGKLAPGCNEAKCYSNFVMKYLHTLTGRLKSLNNETDITQVLDSTVCCCKAYNELQNGLEPDKAYTVPKIVYHIINHFKNKHTHVEQLIYVSDLVYQMLCTDSLKSDGHTLVNGLYACLWNTCCKLAATVDKGSTEALDVRLKLRRCSLLFLSFLPDKGLVLEKLRCVVSHYQQVTTDGSSSAFITTCCDIMCDMFQGIIDNTQKTVCTSESHCFLIAVRGMYVDFLIKCTRYSDARNVAKSISQTGDSEGSIGRLSEAVSHIYCFLCETLLDRHEDKASQVDFQILSRGCQFARDIIQSTDVSTETMFYLYEPFYVLTQMVGKKTLSAATVSSKDADILMDTCDIFLDIVGRLLSENKVERKEEGKEEGKKGEEHGRLCLAVLVIHYRQLQFLLQCIQSGSGGTSCNIPVLLEKCVERVTQLHQRLDESAPNLVSSVEFNHRYNCGYICSSLGKISVQEKHYDWAAIFYKIAVQQLYLCKNSNLPRLYEMLIECYIKQEMWLEGTRVVIESLLRVQEGLTFSVTVWTRLKMAALTSDPHSFLDISSLCSAVKSSDTQILGITDRQILYAEYQTWKKMNRKELDVKHNLLCELYRTPQSPVELGEVMVELAISMCISGYTHNDSTAGEVLSKAIIQLDKESGTTVEALLAIAHYMKYVVCHEEAIEKIQLDNTSQLEGSQGENQSISNGHMIFTFQSEMPYLPFLERAIQLWESSLGVSDDNSNRCEKLKGDHQEPQVDLEQHIDALILCGSRLLAMRQNKLAWRALCVARSQLDKVSDQKQAAELWSHMSQVLLVLGRYEEAEEIISDIISRDPSDKNCLLYAELCLLMGKKEEGMATLNTVLSRQELSRRTQNIFLIDGTAKRLLSMFLCFPEGHVILSTNEYLLSLAFEAVRCHISVLNFMTNKKVQDNNADKWLLTHEILQSLLHLCQLYRFTGLPRDALCYLKEGLRISQTMGLPRWSCEFLYEILHIRSMTAECDQGVEIVESINSILATSDRQDANSGISTNPKNNTKATKKKKEGVKAEKSAVLTATESHQQTDGQDTNNCFGFGELSSKDKVKPVNVTPEKEFVKEELDSAKKEQMTKISLPQCSCVQESVETCEDVVRHRLCLQAGIVLSEFLVHSDMRDTAGRLLADLHEHLDGRTKGSQLSAINFFELDKQNVKSIRADPKMVYICLEASCLQVENYLHLKEFNKIQSVWENLSKLEQTGCLNNVLHSNILLSRLALCNASSYMFTKYSSCYGNQTMIGNKSTEMGSAGDKLTKIVEPLNVNNKKVTFGNEEQALIVEGTALKGARRKLLKDNSIYIDDETPSTPKGKPLSTFISSSKKQKLNRLLITPATSRKAALDLLMESDNDDDDDADVVFPELKPVTPKVAKSTKSKTEPRKSRNARIQKSNSVPVCKISDSLDNEGQNSENNDDPIVNDQADNGCDEALSEEKKDIERLEDGMEGLSLETGQKSKSKIPLAVKKTDKEDDSEVKGTTKQKSRKQPPKKTRTANKENKDDAADIVKPKTEVSDTELNVQADQAAGESVLTENCDKANLLCKYQSGTPLINPTDGDVYDFDLQASPAVTKQPKKGKGNKTVTKTIKSTSNTNTKKSAVAAKKTNSKTSRGTVSKGVENSLISSPDSEKVETKTRTTRVRRGKKADPVENMRNTSSTDSEIELNISYQEIEHDTETVEGDRNHYLVDAFCVAEPCSEIVDMNEDCDVDALVESPVTPPVTPVLADSMSHSFSELESYTQGKTFGGDSCVLEPIEIMRGDTKRKGRSRGAQAKKADVVEETKRQDEVEEIEAGVERSGAGMEKMRSGKLASLKSLTDRMNCEPDICEPAPAAYPGQSEVSPLQPGLVSSLETLYKQTRHLAPYPEHPDLCHMLALHYLDTNPQRAAFLLTDSIAVTFRHQAMLNMGKKVRKQNEAKTGATSVSCDQLTCVRDELLFDKDEQHLEKMINVIPQDWNVIQLSVVNPSLPCRQFILTRFVRDHPPLVLRLPAFNTPQGRDLLKDFTALLEMNRSTAKIDSKEEWWSLRDKLDKDLQTITEHLETFWIGPWKSVFRSREYSEETIRAVKEEVWKATKVDINVPDTEILLMSVQELNDTQLMNCASELLRSQVNQSQLRTLISVIKKHAEPNISRSDSHHVVLILDKTVQHLPWESMPCLLPLSVSRMPCLAHLYTQLNFLHNQESSVFTRGVNPRHTYYIVNPDSNLQHTDERFRDWFQSEKSWTGVIGSRPTKEQFTEALTSNDLLIYCGHGSGGRFFNSDEVEKLQGRAATVLMGCSSGKLLAKGQLEPSGMMISYFLAGCPCMVANLWDVTDKDIDKFTAEFLRTWLAEDGGSLPRFVQKSRQACKMKFLNGSAPVVYGLPVFINKKAKC